MAQRFRSPRLHWLPDWLPNIILLLFALDRLAKLAAIIHFFKRSSPPDPPIWPSVTLLQPITRGVSGLANSLDARARLDYQGAIQYLFICDSNDATSQKEVNKLLARYPQLQAQIFLAPTQDSNITAKTEKLLLALPHATGEVLCFIDDDVAPRPRALYQLLPPLLQPETGAVFGLACYTNWDTVWSSLMSIFVNANALISYIPITYLTEPFTITGHCFALTRETFAHIGELAHLEVRVDDDHEIARRVRKAGLHVIQTPMIYDVDNYFGTFSSYAKQMKRWFIFPRQTMIPFMTLREQCISLLASCGQVLPALLVILAVLSLKRSVWQALVASTGMIGAIYLICELCYLKRLTPLERWPLVPLVAIIGPLQVLGVLLSNEEIEWRGQRLRIHVGGTMEKVS